MTAAAFRKRGNACWLIALASAVVSFASGHQSAAGADTTGRFATVRICIVRAEARDPWIVDVELADTAAQRERGLMERASLPADAGMLFRYAELQPPSAGFWMPHVPFPVDIAYLDAAGVVLAIRTMLPCHAPTRTPCPIYPAGVPFRGALEVNGGTMATHGIRPGHARVVLCPTGRRAD